MSKPAGLWIALAVFAFASETLFGQVGSGSSKATVDLLSSVEAFAPGQPFEVALRFRLAKGWHIYWLNSGDSGQPPRVQWTLPAGFTAGNLRFPIPKRHQVGGITTNILKHDPVLLLTIRPPETITDSRITITGKVDYLICKDLCVKEKASVRLELPVAAGSGEVKLANKEVFGRARAAMPSRTSKYLSVTPAASVGELSPGQRFELTLTVNINRGYHIQSHKPTNPSFIKCDVFLERSKDIRFGEPVYPKPKLRSVQYLGKLSEYSGRFVIRVPAEVDAEATHGSVDLGGLVTYQACNNKGTCFPPDALAFSLAPAASIQKAEGGQAAAPSDLAVTGRSPQPTATGLVRDSEASDEGSNDDGSSTGSQGWWKTLRLLLGCFVYGLVLNATPCVLPLLSIKVLTFVQQAHESRRRTLGLGLAFGVGVILFFVLLGFLAAGGRNLLQYPAAVITLGAVVMALALSMLGVYTLQVPTAATKLEATIQKEGLLSSFGKGALAPVLGFACTGPALAFAFAWAAQQAPHIAIFAFLLAGLGMASPYMLLGANPNWLSFLPKPGNWMIIFERIMGFFLLGMVVLLIHPLVVQIGPAGLEWTIAFFVAIGFSCWLLGRIDLSMSAPRRWRYRGGAVTIVVVSGAIVYGWVYPLEEAHAREVARRTASQSSVDDWSLGIPWQTWSAQAVDHAVRAGKTVFVDVTAAYCTNCKANKAAALGTSAARAKIEELGVVAFQADFTDGDPQIFRFLKQYERLGPPLNLIYPAGKPDEPIVLTPLFSLEVFLRGLDEAGPSRDAPPLTGGSSE